MVNMWTRVRHLKELLAVVVQDSHRVKDGLLQLNPTTPLLIMVHMQLVLM